MQDVHLYGEIGAAGWTDNPEKVTERKNSSL